VTIHFQSDIDANKKISYGVRDLGWSKNHKLSALMYQPAAIF